MKSREKMRLSVVVFVVCLAHTLTAFAGTAGNPSSPCIPKGKGAFEISQTKNVSVNTSFDFEYIFDRKLESPDSSDLEVRKGEWYMGGISTTLFKRFSPYVKIGAAHFHINWKEHGVQTKLESETNLAWGGGGKILIWEFKRPKLRLVGDGFYRMADLEVYEGYFNSEKLSLNRNNSRFLIREWQAALLASTEFDIAATSLREDVIGISLLVPYIGVKYSDMSGRLRQILSDSADYHNPGKFESAKKFGVIFGCDFVGPNSVSVNVETRFIDETAITGGLSVLF